MTRGDTGVGVGAVGDVMADHPDLAARQAGHVTVATLDELTQRGHDMRAKVPPVRNANGYSKDRFTVDLVAGAVTCPARHTVTIGTGARHRLVRFGVLCQYCPLRADCTKARRGRVISIHPHEATRQHAKAPSEIRFGSTITAPTGPWWSMLTRF